MSKSAQAPWRDDPPRASAVTVWDTPGGVTEDGTYLSPCLLELMAYLDDCLDKLDAGREVEIIRDPFWESGLTDVQCDELIRVIDEDCAKEIRDFPSYHARRQGCNAPPDYARLSPGARRAVAEGCLAILRRHQETAMHDPPDA